MAMPTAPLFIHGKKNWQVHSFYLW